MLAKLDIGHIYVKPRLKECSMRRLIFLAAVASSPPQAVAAAGRVLGVPTPEGLLLTQPNHKETS